MVAVFVLFFAVFYIFPEFQQHVRKSVGTDHGHAVALLLYEPSCTVQRSMPILRISSVRHRLLYGRWSKKILTDFSLCGIVRKDKSKALKAFQGIVSFQREGVSGCKLP